jgi:hypothetical protein
MRDTKADIYDANNNMIKGITSTLTNEFWWDRVVLTVPAQR